MTLFGGPLFDRATELDRIQALVDNLRGGVGNLMVVEGHAGVGKTALVAAAVELAHANGVRTIVSRANEMEQGYAFAVVRQLMERASRTIDTALWRNWLVGPAADAARLLAVGGGEGEPALDAGADVGFALLHGLYWLAVEVSEDQPTLFVVDDAHWVDEPSLRFLNFLAARLDTAPVGLMVATRPGRAEMGPLIATPGARVERPRALGIAAVTSWLTQDFGIEPGAEFVAAVRRATSGNPFLIRELIREIDLENISPDDSQAERVPLLAPDSVVAATAGRLLGLPERALALANAVAVLEESDLPDAAALSGLTLSEAHTAWLQLTVVELVPADEPLRFHHPLMRTVLYRKMTMDDRSVAHERAAHLLADRGADIELVAAHLLLTFTTDAWLVQTLREAANRALTLGSSTGAVTYLRRALAASPVDSRERIEIKLALADAMSMDDAVAAIGLLNTVRETATEVVHRTEAAVRISRIQRLRGNGGATVDRLLEARADLGPTDHQLAAAIDTELLAASSLSCSARLRLRGWLCDQPIPAVAHTPWDHLLVASSALDSILDGEPAPVATAMAARAATGSQTDMDPIVFAYVMLLVGLTYLAADEFPTATAIFTDLVTASSRPLQPSTNAIMLAHRGSSHLRLGRLADAESDALRAMELEDQSGTIKAMLPRIASVLVSVSTERDELPPMRYLTDDLDRDSTSYRHLALSRAELTMAQGHHASAADQFAEFGRQNSELGYRGATSPWRSSQALCLQALGRRDQARELAEEELAIARHAETPRAIGVALHACGLLATGDRRRELLTESVETFSNSPVLLEPARALTDLAEEHSSQGQVTEARSLLRAALDLAQDAGSTRLTRQVTEALARAGARPSSRRASGSGSLTPSERSICRHAASGLSNREIAQALFVTEKTVEAHLRNAFRKLGIKSRRDLPTTL